MAKTTWRELIAKEMSAHGESFDDTVSVVMRSSRFRDDAGKASLDREFDSGYGCAEGDYFTLWTRKRVYFPACYDGSEWCVSVPRVPNGEATEHVGG